MRDRKIINLPPINYYYHFLYESILEFFSKFVSNQLRMKALLVQSNSEAEMKFIADLLKKLGVSTRVMDAEEIEDYGMSILMKDVDRNKKVSRDTVMKKFKPK